MKKQRKKRIDTMLSEQTYCRLIEHWANFEPELSRSQLIEKAIGKYLAGHKRDRDFAEHVKAESLMAKIQRLSS